MTRKTNASERSRKSKRAGGPLGRRPQKRQPSGRWLLQDAKARFSEVVRCAKTEGPQLVTVHGREEVVVLSVDEFRRLKAEDTGQSLVDACAASPHRDLNIAPKRGPAPVRDVVL